MVHHAAEGVVEVEADSAAVSLTRAARMRRVVMLTVLHHHHHRQQQWVMTVCRSHEQLRRVLLPNLAHRYTLEM